MFDENAVVGVGLAGLSERVGALEHMDELGFHLWDTLSLCIFIYMNCEIYNMGFSDLYNVSSFIFLLYFHLFFIPNITNILFTHKFINSIEKIQKRQIIKINSIFIK